MKTVFAALAALVMSFTPALAQSTNTNGSTAYTPTTPNPVSVPFVPTMYINGGGPGAAGANAVKFIHDWGKYGMEAARACDRKSAAIAINTLMGYEATLGGAYDQASASGQDGSALLNDAAVIASVVNYIRQALAACPPPQHAMLVPSPPPGEEYATLPRDHHDDNPLGGVSIGIGIGVGGSGHDDHHHGHDDNRDNNRDDHGGDH
jgi:hypothetical protein